MIIRSPPSPKPLAETLCQLLTLIVTANVVKISSYFQDNWKWQDHMMLTSKTNQVVVGEKINGADTSFHCYLVSVWFCPQETISLGLAYTLLLAVILVATIRSFRPSLTGCFQIQNQKSHFFFFHCSITRLPLQESTQRVCSRNHNCLLLDSKLLWRKTRDPRKKHFDFSSPSQIITRLIFCMNAFILSVADRKVWVCFVLCSCRVIQYC